MPIETLPCGHLNLLLALASSNDVQPSADLLRLESQSLNATTPPATENNDLLLHALASSADAPFSLERLGTKKSALGVLAD
jgi:hypothetical protein